MGRPRSLVDCSASRSGVGDRVSLASGLSGRLAKNVETGPLLISFLARMRLKVWWDVASRSLTSSISLPQRQLPLLSVAREHGDRLATSSSCGFRGSRINCIQRPRSLIAGQWRRPPPRPVIMSAEASSPAIVDLLTLSSMSEIATVASEACELLPG